MGQRHEDVHGLAQDLVLFVVGHGVDGADIVEPVRQLDEHYTDIVIECQYDALEVLSLEISSAVGIHCRLYLGKAVYQGGYLLAEKPLDVVHCIVSVLHHIMQKGGYD